MDLKLEQRVTLPTSSVVRMLADPYKISQVIRNLLSNALKFTGSNGSVLVVLSLENNNCSSSGSDDGGARLSNSMMDEKLPDIIEMGAAAAAASSLKRAGGCLSKLLLVCRTISRDAEVYAESTSLVISVTDSGAGISKVRSSAE